MDDGSSGGRGCLQRFRDDGYKTWLRTTMTLLCLKTRLDGFLENETDVFHKTLRGRINLKENQCHRVPKCETVKPKPNQDLELCNLCAAWKHEIWAQHTAKGSVVYWNNCTPHLWPSHKWEVAKVYMPGGNKKHQSVDEFDISAFLNLMTFCGHFKAFATKQLLTQVTNVRNRVMHSASFEVSAEDFQLFAGRIRALGEALGEKVPEFQSFSRDVAEVQNIDFNFQLKSYTKYNHESILNMELKIMKDKMECLAELYYADRENMLTSEELQKVRGFLDRNQDLMESLRPQWQRLEAVQAQQGQQINTLTGRMDNLEKQTAGNTDADAEFSNATFMYKNRLLERAIKCKWPAPVFSEQNEPTGFRGQVEVNGTVFVGSQVCRSKIDAHQEVARKALKELDAMANEGAASGQADQAQTVSHAGPSFFAAVTVALDADVSADIGDRPAPADRADGAYEKLVALFGLEASDAALSNKEKVLQYCSRLGVRPPGERTAPDGVVLRLNGQITFYDLEGSTRRVQAEQQAARVAADALHGVLGTASVFKDNHKNALKELLERRKQAEKPRYSVTESPEGGGETVTWQPGGDDSMEDGGEVGAEGQADQAQTVSHAGPSFFAAVTVALDADVSADIGDRPAPADRADGAYEKLVALFGLEASDAALSNKEKVLQYCSRLGVRPPGERTAPDGVVLRLNGQITFYDLEGSTRRVQAEQQAARAAADALHGVLGTASVFKDNHKNALKELLERRKQAEKPRYSVTEIPGGGGETVTWQPGGDDSMEEGGEDGAEGTLSAIVSPMKRMWAPCCDVPSKMTKMLPSPERSASPDDARFIGSVQVTIKLDLRPCQAADQEGAVGAAYRDLMKAFSLSPASSGGERQAVLEFFKQTRCLLPLEKIDQTPNGTYRCSLSIDGKLTFQTSERTSTKREAEQRVAQEALSRLEGLLAVMPVIELPGEDKVRLQKVADLLGKIGLPMYGIDTDGGRFLGSVQVTIQVDLRPRQAPDQEGAVGAAYSDLMRALSLGPASSGGERQAVLEFLEQTQCCPPEEELETATSGIHQCALKLKGKFTFQSPEQTSTKKEAEKLAARRALGHLEGLLSVKDARLPGGDNHKGRLQELLMARLGNVVVPAYSTTDGNDPQHN